MKTGIGGVLRTRRQQHRTTALVGNLVGARRRGHDAARPGSIVPDHASAYCRAPSDAAVCTVRNLPPGTVVRLRYVYNWVGGHFGTGRTTRA